MGFFFGNMKKNKPWKQTSGKKRLNIDSVHQLTSYTIRPYSWIDSFISRCPRIGQFYCVLCNNTIGSNIYSDCPMIMISSIDSIIHLTQKPLYFNQAIGLVRFVSSLSFIFAHLFDFFPSLKNNKLCNKLMKHFYGKSIEISTHDRKAHLCTWLQLSIINKVETKAAGKKM